MRLDARIPNRVSELKLDNIWPHFWPKTVENWYPILSVVGCFFLGCQQLLDRVVLAERWERHLPDRRLGYDAICTRGPVLLPPFDGVTRQKVERQKVERQKVKRQKVKCYKSKQIKVKRKKVKSVKSSRQIVKSVKSSRPIVKLVKSFDGGVHRGRR